MNRVPLSLQSIAPVLLLAAAAQSAAAITLQARGIDSGLVAISRTLTIADAPPIGDLLEFRVFYAANAANGETMDYDGMEPILESDLVDDAAHLFVVEKSGALALFVVYKRQAGTQSADATLSAGAGDFSLADIVVRDAAGDDYAIVDGEIVTSHRITLEGRTDGYVALLTGRFDGPGDVLAFDFATPVAGTSDLPFASIQVYAGLDPAGDPIWFEIDSGPFSPSTPRRIELSFLSAVPSLGLPARSGLALVLSLLGVVAVRRITRRARRDSSNHGRPRLGATATRT